MSLNDSNSIWGYAPLAGATTALQSEVVAAPVVRGPVLNPTLTQDEMNGVREQIEQYNGSPEIQGAIAQLITSQGGDPERLSELVRQLMDQIAIIKADPHRPLQNVSPEIAGICEDIQQAEQAKPDPLNAFRGEGLAKEDTAGMLMNVLTAGAYTVAPAPTVAANDPEMVVSNFQGANFPTELIGLLAKPQTPDVSQERGRGAMMDFA